jgi:hypothetical protein
LENSRIGRADAGSDVGEFMKEFGGLICADMPFGAGL